MSENKACLFRGEYNIPAEPDADVITVEYVHEIYGGPASGRGGSCVTVAASAVTSGSGADGGVGRGEKLAVEVDAAGAGLHV